MKRPENGTRKRVVGALVGLLVLPYLGYRALWGAPMDESTLVPLVGILIILLLFYASHCFRILRSRQTDHFMWLRFVLVSVIVLVTSILNFASIYRVVGLVPPSQTVSPSGGTESLICTEPGACLYFAVITWTTVGYGDFTPTPAARPYAAIEAMFGYLFMAIFVPTLIYATNVLGHSNEDPAGPNYK